MAKTSSLVRDLFEQAFNQGNLAIVDKLVSVDSPVHIPGWGMPANRLGLKQMIANLRAAFPNLHCTVDDEIEGESKSAVLWAMRGTHNGSFFRNLPTGKRVEAQGFVFTHRTDRQITEGWFLIDQMSILQQLGVAPPPQGII